MYTAMEKVRVFALAILFVVGLALTIPAVPPVLTRPPQAVRSEMFHSPSVSPNNNKATWIIGGSGVSRVASPNRVGVIETTDPREATTLNPFTVVENNPAEVEGTAQGTAYNGLPPESLAPTRPDYPENLPYEPPEVQEGTRIMKKFYPFHTSGTSIFDALGNNVTAMFASGVSKMGLEYDPGTYRETDPAYYAADADMMAAWGVRFVRVPTNRAWYSTSQSYRDNVHRLVDVLAERGIVTVVELHWWETGQLPHNYVLSYDQAGVFATGAIDYLTDIARNFLYQPMMIGVEINEFRPKFNVSDGGQEYEYLFRFELWDQLATSVHAVNPDLLVFNEIGYGGRGDSTDPTSSYYTPEDVMQTAQSLIAGHRNLVLAPHCYFTSEYGREWVADEYALGADAGKTAMYFVLDNYYLSQQRYYGLPTVCTEWGGDHEYGPLVVVDEFDYFMAHNWGGAYWAWFRQKPEHAFDNLGMALLTWNWTAPSLSGQAYADKLVEYFVDDTVRPPAHTPGPS
jgi:hypothetical protein